MALARFSEAFLLLRASQTGWSLAWLPLIITAIAVLVGNLLAGVLWETTGAAYTFLAGAGLSLLACVGVVALASRLRN